jgi:hypothetical protein
VSLPPPLEGQGCVLRTEPKVGMMDMVLLLIKNQRKAAKGAKITNKA